MIDPVLWCTAHHASVHRPEGVADLRCDVWVISGYGGWRLENPCQIIEATLTKERPVSPPPCDGCEHEYQYHSSRGCHASVRAGEFGYLGTRCKCPHYEPRSYDQEPEVVL